MTSYFYFFSLSKSLDVEGSFLFLSNSPARGRDVPHVKLMYLLTFGGSHRLVSLLANVHIPAYANIIIAVRTRKRGGKTLMEHIFHTGRRDFSSFRHEGQPVKAASAL